MRYYKIFVDNTNALFTYADPEDSYEVGERVKVPFRGKSGKGTIIAPEPGGDFSFKVLPIAGPLPDEIRLPAPYIELLVWISDYYMCGLPGVFRAVTPKNLKLKMTKLLQKKHAAEVGIPEKKSRRKTRIKAGVQEAVAAESPDSIPDESQAIHISLTSEQERARDEILREEKKLYLLRGVTGSGKTEIYIELIKHAFSEGRGSIFLVPEISLTPQLITRFRKTFGDHIAILHSHLTPAERSREWYSLYTGEKKIVLGVRSAVFAPVQNLKYIILDEEHETTYKQDANPRYHAKFVALKRSRLENLTVVLGSATPSIESYSYTETGLCALINLDRRYNNSLLPSIELVDMRGEEDLYFSRNLLREIRDALLRKEQVILFLNRKGYSTYIQCTDCGYVEECPHCSIKFSYYASRRVFKCNYCGETKAYTGKCGKCGGTNLVHSGKGIERVEEEIKKYFDVPVISVDSDKARERDFYDQVYGDFAAGKYSILIGTQVVAKGLHFPNVTLVGVINADTILNFPDFRSAEKTYQLITQVAGRAGRGDKAGKVIVQTYQPENYTFRCVIESDYARFYKKEMETRRLYCYPPFSKTINIGLSSANEASLERFAKEFRKRIADSSVTILGPMPSLVYRVKDRYRYNIFILGERKALTLYKRKLAAIVDKEQDGDRSGEKNVRISIDIDPVNLI
ncbi:MAG: primosomal protein N' [Fusobacteriaceae bacterium]|jgi:primosomal protein N' (replication factor Y)|nr:primosomal protein N' [Fusobacteriaceae bacterium]